MRHPREWLLVKVNEQRVCNEHKYLYSDSSFTKYSLLSEYSNASLPGARDAAFVHFLAKIPVAWFVRTTVVRSTVVLDRAREKELPQLFLFVIVYNLYLVTCYN